MTFAMIGRCRNGRVFWKVPGDALDDVPGTKAADVLAIENDATGVRPKDLVMRRSSVVLPAPLGPIRPTISSRLGVKLTLLTAR